MSALQISKLNQLMAYIAGVAIGNHQVPFAFLYRDFAAQIWRPSPCRIDRARSGQFLPIIQQDPSTSHFDRIATA